MSTQRDPTSGKHLPPDGDARAYTQSWQRLVLFASLFVNIVFCAVLLRDPAVGDVFDIFRSYPPQHTQAGLVSVSNNLKHCRTSPSRPPLASPPVPLNPWASLEPSEIAQIELWLREPERDLNLTLAKHASSSDNVVYLIEAYYPPKNQTLAYLEDSENVAAPSRLARIVIHHGGWQDPVVRSYLVGPLPLNDRTTIRPLTEIYDYPDIPFNARGLASITELPLFLAKAIQPIAPAIEELFGARVRGHLNDTLVGGMSGPFSYDGSFRRLWMTWRRNTAGSYLLPVNFYQYIDVSGTDPSQWKILKTIYHGQVFDTLESFKEAFDNDTLSRHPEQSDPTVDYSWPNRTRIGPRRDLDHLPGPRSVSFSGLRYRVDRKQRYVSWMGWAMYLGFDRDMGLNLWDIRFRGERLIYQLQPQEAIAQYGGNDPVQSTTAWLDRHFGMGGLVRDMIPYYDCPQEATYLPATTYSILGVHHVKRAICIFEQDTGKPLTRHLGWDEGESGAVKSYVLTIRTATSVGNYDYLFDYLFYLDGTIEVRLSASGYMQGGFWNKEQETYGGRIRTASMGNVHDHVINYKVDFDIAGRENSLLRTTTKQEEVQHNWFDDEWGNTVIQQKIEKEYITNENDAMLRHALNFQGNYAIVNKDALNKWGTPRGYVIHPGYSSIYNTVTGSKRLLNNANWAQYNLAISLRKETEPSSSSMWNLHLPGKPPVDFHKFFDGDNITQRDLVAWVNLGMHHLPQAEDSPMTKTNIATSSFVLAPLNYFDYDVSMELQNGVLLHEPLTPGGAHTFDDYGVRQDFTCVPEHLPPFEYKEEPFTETDGSFADIDREDIRRQAEGILRVRLEV